MTGSPLTLGLTHAELERITAGGLTVGDAAGGAITISAAITRRSATDVRLISGGGIDLTASSVSFADGAPLAIRINGTTVDAQYTQLKGP